MFTSGAITEGYPFDKRELDALDRLDVDNAPRAAGDRVPKR